MTASELIEKIHNNEIKVGAKIICRNEYIGFKLTRYFMGNWFSKVPPEEHMSDTDYDTDIILYFCDNNVTYEIIDENKIQEKISKLQSEIDKLSNEIKSYYSKIHSMRDRNNYMKEQLKKLMKEVK